MKKSLTSVCKAFKKQDLANAFTAYYRLVLVLNIRHSVVDFQNRKYTRDLEKQYANNSPVPSNNILFMTALPVKIKR